MTDTLVHRLEFLEVPPSGPQATLRDVVEQGLSRADKRLPCRFFYDHAGSELFERICELPEYYLTRTEQSILEHSAADIVRSAGPDLMLVELGSGSSMKTRILIDALLNRQQELRYTPVDISREFLRASADRLLREYPRLTVTAVAAEYHDAIDVLPDHDGPRLILFLGSNIGNFEPEAASRFLRRIRGSMEPQDRILVGVDLLKETPVIEAAYNDSSGVTGAFNKNLLLRINRELGGCFDLEAFRHDAPFIAARSCVEMRLVSRTRQDVPVRALGRSFRFEEGEYIHTEDSHKFSEEILGSICHAAGLTILRRWSDPRHWFAVTLLGPA